MKKTKLTNTLQSNSEEAPVTRQRAATVGGRAPGMGMPLPGFGMLGPQAMGVKLKPRGGGKK